MAAADSENRSDRPATAPTAITAKIGAIWISNVVGPTCPTVSDDSVPPRAVGARSLHVDLRAPVCLCDRS